MAPAASAAREPSRSASTSWKAPCHVEALPGAAAQQPDADQVDRQAHRRHRQHGQALHLRRRLEAAPGLGEDGAGDGEQHGGVDGRGQDLRPGGAVGAPRGRRPAAEPDGDEGQRQAEDVGAHVGGVGEQGQAAGEDAPEQLHQQVPAGEGQHQGQPAAVPAGGAPGGRRGRRGAPAAAGGRGAPGRPGTGHGAASGCSRQGKPPAGAPEGGGRAGVGEQGRAVAARAVEAPAVGQRVGEVGRPAPVDGPPGAGPAGGQAGRGAEGGGGAERDDAGAHQGARPGQLGLVLGHPAGRRAVAVVGSEGGLDGAGCSPRCCPSARPRRPRRVPGPARAWRWVLAGASRCAPGWRVAVPAAGWACRPPGRAARKVAWAGAKPRHRHRLGDASPRPRRRRPR